MYKPTQEQIITGLLLATLAVLLANQLAVRTITFDKNSVSQIFSTDDREHGGTTNSSAELVNGNLRINYDVDPLGHPTPFAKLVIHHQEPNNENSYLDLSWVDYFEINARCNKSGGEHYLFTLRNFEPNVSEAKDFSSLKYNESLIRVSDEMSKIVIKRDQFSVPTWWQRKFNVTGNDAYPSFRNTQWCEFSTEGDVGSGELEVQSIKCSGHWMNPAALNRTLLWLWMGGALIACLYRMFGLKKKLSEKTASAMELLEHNNMLMSESATYHELARRDPLTGLYNRYGLEGELEALMTASAGSAYSMILFDLDDFKNINDDHGHCYGDRVLFDISRIADSKIRNTDIIARWGGDEFLIVLFEQNVSQAKALAEEIRQEVVASDLRYTCSFGISKLGANGSFERAFRNADTALYESKNAGRDAINVFKNEIDKVEGNSPNAEEVGEMQADQAPVILLPIAEDPSVGFSIYD